jgi:antitoxin (DNA-binding transcriptional repressor) of toxin-antitoxin stability system
VGVGRQGHRRAGRLPLGYDVGEGEAAAGGGLVPHNKLHTLAASVTRYVNRDEFAGVQRDAAPRFQCIVAVAMKPIARLVPVTRRSYDRETVVAAASQTPTPERWVIDLQNACKMPDGSTIDLQNGAPTAAALQHFLCLSGTITGKPSLPSVRAVVYAHMLLQSRVAAELACDALHLKAWAASGVRKHAFRPPLPTVDELADNVLANGGTMQCARQRRAAPLGGREASGWALRGPEVTPAACGTGHAARRGPALHNVARALLVVKGS